MGTDSPTPFATSADFNSTAFADLAVNLQAGELDQIMMQATRGCEDASMRRLSPFTVTETQRMEAGDLEDPSAGAFPLPMAGQMGLDYARALGMGQMARHAWVSEFPPCYPDMWTGSISSVSVYWPYQSSPYVLAPQQWQYDIDTGHVRFLLGTFVPFGSTAYITYSGGYTTVPLGLKRACLAMAASIIVKELDPALGTEHDPDLLRDEAIEFLDPFIRD